MAKAINKSDIIEGKIYDSFIQEATQAQQVLKNFNTELRQNASLLGKKIGDQKIVDTASMNEANIRIKEANSLFQQKIALDKATIQNETLLSRLRQQQVKEQQAVNRAKEQDIKATEKQSRANERAISAYSKINGKLSQTRQEYRDLAIKKELLNNLSAKEETRMATLEKRIGLYDGALKKVDATMGLHQRNVGNYASGNGTLSNSINQLTREMPAFANSVGTGFMAISNNLPIFFDEISKIKKANADLVATGQPTTSMFKQLAGSIFSIGTLLSVGVTLLTVYGSKLVEWGSSLFAVNKELDATRERQKQINKQREESNKYTAKESAEYAGLIYALKQTNAGSKERADLIKKINEQYGTHLKNIKNETDFQNQLNKSLETYIKLKENEFIINSNEERINRLLKEKIGIQQNLLKLQISSNLEKERNLLVSKELEDFDKNLLPSGAQQSLKQAESRLNEIERRLRQLGFQNLTAQDFIDNSGFGGKEKKEKEVKEERDLTREIQDEQVKRIEDVTRKNATELMLNAQRRIEDLSKEKLHADEKAKLVKEINKTLLHDLDQLDRKYWEDIDKIRKEAYDKWKEDNNKAFEDEYQIKLKSIEDDAKITEISLLNSEKAGDELKEIEKQNQIDILEQKIELAKEYGKETLDLELELAKLKNEKVNEVEKLSAQDRNAIIKASADYFIEQSNKKIAQLDIEIAKHEKAYSLYAGLAEKGNITAKESLALENQQIVEANKKKMEEQKKQQRWKLVESALTAYSSNAEKDPKNALSKTITDVTLLTAFINSLPAFYEGTDTTVADALGAPMFSGRDGHVIRVDGSEKILNPALSAMTGNMTTSEIAKVANDYQSGKLVNIYDGATHVGGNWNFDPLLNEIKELKDIMKNKKETDLRVGDVLHKGFEFIQSETKGNTQFVNRYQIRK